MSGQHRTVAWLRALVCLAAVAGSLYPPASQATGPSGSFSAVSGSELYFPFLNPLPAQPGLARGKFLVASRGLQDPNFVEAVVLLLRYDDEGAMGLIINRPTGMKAAELLPEIEELEERGEPVYLGGPVAVNRILLLVRTEGELEETDWVFQDVYVSTSRELLQQLAVAPRTKNEFRIYAGYAGWGPGQLDREVAVGGWHILPGDADTVFADDPGAVWPRLIRRDSEQWVSAPCGRCAS